MELISKPIEMILCMVDINLRLIHHELIAYLYSLIIFNYLNAFKNLKQLITDIFL